MSAAKANNNRDTYKATAITLIVFGILYLVDKLVHFFCNRLAVGDE